MKKRLFWGLLVLALIAALVPTAALAALASNEQFVIEDGVLLQYAGPGGDIVIPDGVTRIDGWAFYNCSSVSSVTFPNSLTSIGSPGFYLNFLEVRNFPDSISQLGRGALGSVSPATDHDVRVKIWKLMAQGPQDPQQCVTGQSASVVEASEEITEGLGNDYEKAEAICKWVSRNIAYDYGQYYQSKPYEEYSSVTAEDQYIASKASVDKTMYAAEDEVVVRSAPYAVSSNIVKSLKKDDAVKISYSTTNSLGNKWYITSNGLYIYADRLTTTAPAPATPTSTTAQTTPPAKTPDAVTFSNYQVRELTSTSAEPYATATAKTGKVARVGMYIGIDKNNLTELGTDNGTPKNYKNMWYNTTKYNYPLKPSTTYYYQPFAEVDGVRYYGDIKSFTTKEPESMVTFSNYKVRNLTATSAEPYATATAKSGKVARVGMYIGTDKNNLTQLGTDNGTPKPYKNMWYNTTKYGYTIKPNAE